MRAWPLHTSAWPSLQVLAQMTAAHQAEMHTEPRQCKIQASDAVDVPTACQLGALAYHNSNLVADCNQAVGAGLKEDRMCRTCM